MPAYVIFIRHGETVDKSEMDEYKRKTTSLPLDPKLTPLVVYGQIEALEKTPPAGVVLLEFPTVEDAKAWYYGAGYQDAARHRIKGADYSGFIVQGL